MGPPIVIGGGALDLPLDVTEAVASMGPPIVIGGGQHPLIGSGDTFRQLQWGRRS